MSTTSSPAPHDFTYGNPTRQQLAIQRAEAHCDVLWQWLDLVTERVEQDGEDADPNLRKIAEAAPAIRLAVSKSSYLGRRLYGFEGHRTEPCPIHQGRWSGLPSGETPCGCDLTGWLPA